MNVMTKAHAMTKATVAEAAKAGVKLSYADMFKAALKDCHKKAKEAMANPVFSRLALKLQILENITDVAGFVVVVGGMCVDWVSHRINAVQNAPTCAFASDAMYWATRVRNGNNESGVVMTKAEQIEIEKANCKQVMNEILFA